MSFCDHVKDLHNKIFLRLALGLIFWIYFRSSKLTFSKTYNGKTIFLMGKQFSLMGKRLKI